jgi:glyoxylase-like metal-dependent hydrolase (beta-lactamase superfamily II)
MTLRIDLVRTNGIFSLDGQDFEVENNIWLLGDDEEVLVIDAAHDAMPIMDAVGGRNVLGIFLTHGHNDHISVAAALRELVDAPVLLHPADRMLWDVVYEASEPDSELRDGDELVVAGTRLRVLHTPGHSPGGVCLLDPDGHVFGGDTLFKGGPGATGRSYSSFGDIIVSIRERLLTLPSATVVHPGHGDNTTIGAEAPHLDEWLARGH